LINNRQNGRRRGRGGGQGGPPRPNGSSGNQDRGNRIDNRARGNAAQLHEKYKALARDSQMQGDRVNTEYYLQFADHYFRVLSESRSRFEEQQPRPRRDDFTQQSDEDYGDEGERMGNQEQRSQPEPIFASRETDIQRDFGDRPVVDGNRSDRDDEDRRPRDEDRRPRDEDRRPRRAARPPRTEQDMAPASYQAAPAEEAAAPTPAPSEEPAVQPRRRGRPPKVQPSEQIEVDRLPPSFSLQAPVDDGEAKPRPRTRRPRGETAAV
jgi:hypothetical protein